MSKSLPSRPSLEQLRKQAKDLHKQYLANDPTAVARVGEFQPEFRKTTRISKEKFQLHDAQFVIAREYGFATWPKLKEQVEAMLLETGEPIELLKQAFHADDARWLRKLLERFPQFKAQINEPIGPFDSPVIINARSREMLDVLLEAGADINAKSRWWAGGFGLLHGAEPDLAAYAIQRGAVIDVHAAARLGLLEKLRELVSADPRLVTARGGDGQTPLHFASTLEIAAFLLDHGADLNARDLDHESTPAQWMIRERQHVARFLVQRGCQTDVLMAAALGDMNLVRKHLAADPECIHLRVTEEHFPMINPRSGGTIYQWTLGWYVSPHEVARQFGHEDVYQLLLEASPPEVQLIAACWAGDDAAVQSLLKKQARPGTKLSPSYQRHVAHAARNNNLPALRLMLAAGLPVDALGQHRATPLHWAAFHGHAEMIREILRHNPPLELTDADFRATPLGWATYGSEHGWHCETGDYAGTVELLLKAGAKIPERIEGTEAVKKVLTKFPAAGGAATPPGIRTSRKK
jgi:ankyrin repeat protein